MFKVVGPGGFTLDMSWESLEGGLVSDFGRSARAPRTSLTNGGRWSPRPTSHLVKLCEAGMHAHAARAAPRQRKTSRILTTSRTLVKHDQWVWKPPRSMIKSAEASGADKSKLESSAVLRKVQRDFRSMTWTDCGETDAPTSLALRP